MNRTTAPVMFIDELYTTVICPYCKSYHKHSNTTTLGVSYISHCSKGEYVLGDVISPNIILIALKRREADCKRKRKPKADPEPNADKNE